MADLSSRMHVTIGDITRLDADAIVTAANQALMGGGGVDGAVHAGAGPKLVAASRQLAPCPAGEARITPGFNLMAPHVIHAVGPIYRSGHGGEAQLLASAYRSSLSLASEHQLNHIAFPCISTGVYGYPPKEACRVAIDAVAEWLRQNDLPEIVTFCCFQQSDMDLYIERLSELGLTDEP